VISPAWGGSMSIFKESEIYKVGFDAGIDAAIEILDNYESNELAKLSIWDFENKLRQDLLEEKEEKDE
jgi:hypothetical protein